MGRLEGWLEWMDKMEVKYFEIYEHDTVITHKELRALIAVVKAADALIEKLEQGSWQLEAASDYRQARAKIEGE